MRSHHLIVPLILFGSACSSGEDPAAGEKPVWTDAPASITVGEGQTLELALEVSDPDGGEVSVSVGAVAAVDVEVGDDSLRIHAGYGMAAGDFSVRLTDDEGTTSEVNVAVVIPAIGWVDHQIWPPDDGPEEREHGTVFYDMASASAFLFGGTGYVPQSNQVLDDFWRYDLETGSWTSITPTGDIPPGAGSRRFAGAWGAGEGIVFGGYAEQAILADIYRVKAVGGTLDFEQLAPSAVAPSQRSLHTFVHDPQTGRYYLFGGVTDSPLGDTWMLEVNGSVAQWTQYELPTSPSARYGAASGFDEEAGRLILYSGAQGTGTVNAAHDVWALDVRSEPPTWTLLLDGASVSVPSGRRNACAVWDPSGPRLVVFGGTNDSMDRVPGLFAFDARPGHESWATLERAAEPPVRWRGFGFSSDDRLFLGFGSSVDRDWGVLGY